MKISKKLIILFSILIVSTIAVTSYFAIQSTEKSVIASGIEEMNIVLLEKQNQVQTLHNSVSEELVFALQNPVFVDYFELNETKAGDVYKDGVLQFTEKQREIKTQMEQWMYNFQNQFQVDETCVIDTTGKEHAALVLTKIVSDSNLMSDHNSMPYFKPSFKKNLGEVYIQYPYVSQDTNRWVFAYTSPIVLPNGEKPAIYHLEMPISIFQNLMQVKVGRMYVVDLDGFLIADSQHDFSTTNISDIYTKNFPLLSTISTSSEFNAIIQNMRNDGEGSGHYFENGETHYVTYKKLPTFGWYMVYDKPYSLMLLGSTTLGDLKNTIVFVSISITVVGLLGVIMVSTKISRPIHVLKEATIKIAKGDFDVRTNIKTKDEIEQLSSSFNLMAKKIQETLEAVRLKEHIIQQQEGVLLQFSEQSENYLVCIVDIIGSTKLTERLSDLEVSKFYNIFLSSISIIVKDFDGIVVKNVGDSILCYFPKTHSKDPTSLKNALECCLTLSDFNYQLNKKLEHENLPSIKYRISSTYGSVRAAQIATSSVKDIFGSTVNRCAKINYLAPPNGIVIDSSLYEMIRTTESYNFKLIDDSPISKEFGDVYTVSRK